MRTDTTGPATGRRERKKRETRQALQDAALALTLARGASAAVTVEDIADAADVSVRTFFNYFSTKEQAVIAYDPEQPAALHAAVLARPADEQPLTSLRAVLVELAERLAIDPVEREQRLRVMNDDVALRAAQAAAWSSVERSLTEAVATRTGTDPGRDLYPGLVVAAVVGANRVAATRWSAIRSGGGDASLARTVGEAIDALSAGLPAPTARRHTEPAGGTR